MFLLLLCLGFFLVEGIAALPKLSGFLFVVIGLGGAGWYVWNLYASFGYSVANAILIASVGFLVVPFILLSRRFGK
jgi:hypothetical protein